MPNFSHSLSRSAFLGSLTGLISVSVGVMTASGHDAPKGWTYPWSCCSNQDCQEVTGRGISERPDGYVINAIGEVVAYADKRVKDSPDGEYHWCAHKAGIDAGRTICLFVPPKGF